MEPHVQEIQTVNLESVCARHAHPRATSGSLLVVPAKLIISAQAGIATRGHGLTAVESVKANKA